jgi:hypothetical protein
MDTLGMEIKLQSFSVSIHVEKEQSGAHSGLFTSDEKPPMLYEYNDVNGSRFRVAGYT